MRIPGLEPEDTTFKIAYRMFQHLMKTADEEMMETMEVRRAFHVSRLKKTAGEEFELLEETENLREEVREFLAKHLSEMPASSRALTWQGFDPDFSRKLGEQGWIGMTWAPRAFRTCVPNEAFRLEVSWP